MSNTQKILAEYVIAMADDSLILGQRLAEWCSNAPFLEEDLALSNVALDFLGRAQMLYDYTAQLQNSKNSTDPISVDDLAFLRDAREFKNTLLHELPIGDFAHTMARQYLLDSFGMHYMQALTQSSDQTLAAIAEKSIKESRYHLRRSYEWILRLGDGTEESHQRIQTAFDQLWGYTAELFEMSDAETALIEAGISVNKTAFKDKWLAQVSATLKEATLTLPEDDWQVSGGRQGIHTEHLGELLAEMQHLQRAYPGLQW